MVALPPELLAYVVGGNGGDSVTRTRVSVRAFGVGGDVVRETRVPDSEQCRRDVTAACNADHPGWFDGAARACRNELVPQCPAPPPSR